MHPTHVYSLILILEIFIRKKPQLLTGMDELAKWHGEETNKSIYIDLQKHLSFSVLALLKTNPVKFYIWF